ncbi:MAG: hypothetical protein R3261_09450, partial [Alphaproteobacteria bacterium]|nr:hypothetical protein [Alphaproteobacteria bacterium]
MIQFRMRATLISAVAIILLIGSAGGLTSLFAFTNISKDVEDISQKQVSILQDLMKLESTNGQIMTKVSNMISVGANPNSDGYKFSSVQTDIENLDGILFLMTMSAPELEEKISQISGNLGTYRSNVENLNRSLSTYRKNIKASRSQVLELREEGSKYEATLLEHIHNIRENQTTAKDNLLMVFSYDDDDAVKDINNLITSVGLEDPIHALTQRNQVLLSLLSDTISLNSPSELTEHITKINNQLDLLASFGQESSTEPSSQALIREIQSFTAAYLEKITPLISGDDGILAKLKSATSAREKSFQMQKANQESSKQLGKSIADFTSLTRDDIRKKGKIAQKNMELTTIVIIATTAGSLLISILVGVFLIEIGTVRRIKKLTGSMVKIADGQLHTDI